jgi:hypothetical protein
VCEIRSLILAVLLKNWILVNGFWFLLFFLLVDSDIRECSLFDSVYVTVEVLVLECLDWM